MAETTNLRATLNTEEFHRWIDEVERACGHLRELIENLPEFEIGVAPCEIEKPSDVS
jgi:hypothetical protein